MKQVFILGSSSSYGVGAEKTGWGDLVKQYFHAKMYADGGVGEEYEVFNLAKAGVTIDFVQSVFPTQLKQFGRNDKPAIIIISVGGNNSKAEDEPNNYVSTPEEFKSEMRELLKLLRNNSDQVIVVGGGYVDESKTNPKPNPLTGGQSYFKNQRRQQFQNIIKDVCDELRCGFADVGIAEREWVDEYLYQDGLHPNQKGHQLIFESVVKHLEGLELNNP